jgi:ribosomal protein S18 acetylase RimI-like enzyme
MNPTRLTMIRRTLTGIPQFEIPAWFGIRWYRPGDRAVWLRLHAQAEPDIPTSPAIYDQQFAGNETELPRRQAFLLDATGNEIGTGTAWYDDHFQGARYGRIHWLAILPEWRGRGLAKPLLTVLCNQLVALGHDRAYLTTWSTKLPALHLYRSFGFEMVP